MSSQLQLQHVLRRFERVKQCVMTGIGHPTVLTVFTGIVLLLIWQGLVLAFHLPRIVLPPPTDVAMSLVHSLPAILKLT